MKALKILGWVFVGLVVLILAAVIILPLIFDPNDYKDEIAELVHEQTGRDLLIEDDLELSVFPWLGLETGAVTLSNAEGFGEQPFAVLEHLEIRVRLWPLLSRQIEMGRVKLGGLRLNPAHDAEGRNNWDDLFQPREGAPPTSAAEPNESAFAMDALTVEGLELEDASVFWHENVDEVKYIVRNLTVRTGALDMEQPLDVSLGFRLVSTEPQLSADFDLSGRAKIDLDSQQHRIDGLQLSFDVQDGSGESRASGGLDAAVSADLSRRIVSLLDARLDAELSRAPLIGSGQLEVAWAGAVADLERQTFELTDAQATALGATGTMKMRGTKIFDAPELMGSLTVSDAPLKDVIEQLDPTLLEDMEASALGTLDLSTDFSLDVDAGTAEVKNARAGAFGLELQADMALADSGRAGGRIRVPPGDPIQLRRALGTLLPDTVDADTLGKLGFESAVELDLEADTLALDDMKATAFGATADGNVQISKLGEEPRLEGALSIPSFPADRMVDFIGDLLPEGVGARELGKLSLQTEFAYAPENDRVVLSNVRATALGLEFGGNVEATQLSASPLATGTVRFEKFVPRSLLNRLGNRNPDTAGKNALTSATVKTDFALSDSAARFDDIAVKLDKSNVTGSFALENFDTPSYQFDIDVDTFNADHYLPRDEEAAAAAEEVEPTGDVTIPADAFRDLRIDGSIAFGTLTVGGIVSTKVRIRALAKDGLVQLNPAKATLYGGAFEGSVSADARQNVPGVSFAGNLTQLDLRGITQALSESGQAMLRGKGNFNVALEGRGQTVEQTMQSLAGNIGFDIRNGAVLGFNLAHTICSAYNAATRRPRPSREGVVNESEFDLLRGTAVVAGGIGTTDDLTLSSSYMKVTGQGNVDLPEQRVNYDVNATLVDKIEIEGCEALDKHVGKSIPVEIKGPIAEPKIRPDIEELARQQVRDAIEDKVQDKLRDLLNRD